MNQQAGLNLLPTEGKAKTRIYMFNLTSRFFFACWIKSMCWSSPGPDSPSRGTTGGKQATGPPDNSPSPPTVCRRRSVVILRRRMNPVCLIHLRLVNKRFWPAQTSALTQQRGGLKVSFSIFKPGLFVYMFGCVNDSWSLFLSEVKCVWIFHLSNSFSEQIRGGTSPEKPLISAKCCCC